MSQADAKALQKAIKCLDERYCELKDLAPGFSLSKKLELLDQLDLLNVRITRMESVLNHIDAATVTIKEATEEDEEILKDALDTLGQQVAKDMQWSAALKLTKAFLNAARQISDNVTVRTVAQA